MPKHDAGQQARQERQQRRTERREERLKEREERQELAAATTWFPQLGVAVRDGTVYEYNEVGGSWGREYAAGRLKPLGRLAGARAEAGGGTAGRRRSGNARAADAALATAVLGPVGLLAGVSRKGFRGYSVVAFADGTSKQKTFTESAPVIKAQAEAARFNALATNGEHQPGHQDEGLTRELERLTAMHASGALDDEEFRAAKAKVLGG